MASSQFHNSISLGVRYVNEMISGRVIYGKISNQKYSKINANKTNINNNIIIEFYYIIIIIMIHMLLIWIYCKNKFIINFILENM